MEISTISRRESIPSHAFFLEIYLCIYRLGYRLTNHAIATLPSEVAIAEFATAMTMIFRRSGLQHEPL